MYIYLSMKAWVLAMSDEGFSQKVSQAIFVRNNSCTGQLWTQKWLGTLLQLLRQPVITSICLITESWDIPWTLQEVLVGYPMDRLGDAHGISHRQPEGWSWDIPWTGWMMYMGSRDVQGTSHRQAGGDTWDIPWTGWWISHLRCGRYMWEIP